MARKRNFFQRKLWRQGLVGYYLLELSRTVPAGTQIYAKFNVSHGTAANLLKRPSQILQSPDFTGTPQQDLARR